MMVRYGSDQKLRRRSGRQRQQLNGRVHPSKAVRVHALRGFKSHRYRHLPGPGQYRDDHGALGHETGTAGERLRGTTGSRSARFV